MFGKKFRQKNSLNNINYLYDPRLIETHFNSKNTTCNILYGKHMHNFSFMTHKRGVERNLL